MKTVLVSLFFSILLLYSAHAQNQKGNIKSASVDALFAVYDTMQTSGISVLVIDNGRKVYDKSFGLADIARKAHAASTTNYRIASVTKQFTAMAIMMLRDEGKLFLNDPLNKFFPNLPPFVNQITVRNMLNHTSGLPDYGDLIVQKTDRPLADRDILTLLQGADSLIFQPGERFSYSNTAYVLLGLIVEKASGMSFGEFLKNRIFLPIGMTASTINSLTSNIPNRAYGYNLKEGALKMEDQSLYSYLLGDGGIYSSTVDFYKWDQILYTDKLVKQETLNEIFAEQSRENPSSAYGYGWYIDTKYHQKRLSHSGGTTGFSSMYVRYPQKKFSIIIFANQDEGLRLGPITDAIEEIYLK